MTNYTYTYINVSLYSFLVSASNALATFKLAPFSLNALSDVAVSVNVTDAGSGKPSGSRASSTKTRYPMDIFSATLIAREAFRVVNLGPV